MMTLRLRHIFIFAFAILLTACQFEDDQECPDEINVGTSYINLTIAVSNGKATGTRAGEMPASGEDGNGREVGFERENAVTGVTLILYQAADGINTNTSATDPKLEFVRYFPVSRVTQKDQGSSFPAVSPTSDSYDEYGSHNSQIEAEYTTGPQLIGKPGALDLDLNAKYHAIVVANYDLTKENTSYETPAIKKGDNLSKVLGIKLKGIASQGYEDAAHTFTNFIMSSEEDNILSISDGTKKIYDGSRDYNEETDKGQDVLYDLSQQPLIIERMAARIDFWAKGAKYQTQNGNSTPVNYDDPGYVYTPVDESGNASEDRFVLTSITPFNLNNGTEYLLKKLNDGLLMPETGSNNVLDPLTDKKTTGSNTSFDYFNALDGNSLSGSCTVQALHAQVGEGLTGGFTYTEGTGASAVSAEDVIICYPKENTLPISAPLKLYATGLIIEGDYYTNDDVSQKQHCVYYTYIRHQGEKTEAYDALISGELNKTNSATDAMNFGIVRNNIYRVYVDKVMKKTVTEEPKVTLKIKVKKWDRFEHAPIYM